MPRAASQRDAGAAAQPPQKPAHKAEHMIQRQQAQQRILRLQRQLEGAVVGALAQGMVGQHHGLGLLRGAGGEEQELSRAVPHAGLIYRYVQFLHQVFIAPERVDVRIADQGFQKTRRRKLVKQHDLLAREVRRENLLHTAEASVGKDADAGARLALQGLGAALYVFPEPGEAARLASIAQRRGVRPLFGPVGQQLTKRMESHRCPPFIPNRVFGRHSAAILSHCSGLEKAIAVNMENF